MDLSTVTKAEVLNSPKEVNKYLALGWVLASLYTTAYDTEGPGVHHHTQHYVMCWAGDDPQYPEPESSHDVGMFI